MTTHHSRPSQRPKAGESSPTDFGVPFYRRGRILARRRAGVFRREGISGRTRRARDLGGLDSGGRGSRRAPGIAPARREARPPEETVSHGGVRRTSLVGTLVQSSSASSGRRGAATRRPEVRLPPSLLTRERRVGFANSLGSLPCRCGPCFPGVPARGRLWPAISPCCRGAKASRAEEHTGPPRAPGLPRRPGPPCSGPIPAAASGLGARPAPPLRRRAIVDVVI